MSISSNKNIKLIIFIIFIVVLIMASLFLPVKEWLISVLNWIQRLGLWGPVFIILLYIIACILFLPGSILTIGAGFLFKVFTGTIIVSIGSTLGACAAFIVGRTIARDLVANKVKENNKFLAIDEAVGKEGFKIVLLTRLSPIFPFNLLNYAFGLTKVSLANYALASWIGMLPGTIMYVYFGAGLRSLTEEVQTGFAGQLFFWFGMLATVIVTLFVTRLARKTLKQTVSEQNNHI